MPAGDSARINSVFANGYDDKQEKEESEFAQQAEHLAQYKPSQENDDTGCTQDIEARFITPLDPVVETEDGGRLPVISVDAAQKLNRSRRKAGGQDGSGANGVPQQGDRIHREVVAGREDPEQSDEPDAPLRDAIPPSRTNPLFPSLPLHGPPSYLRSIQSLTFRATSTVLSLAFLLTIVAGAAVNSVPRVLRDVRTRAKLQNPRKRRPFYEEEVQRRRERRAAEKEWVRQQRGRAGDETPSGEKGTGSVPQDGEFVPTEGGPDPLILDVGHYARRVGLDCETFEVQTEDGFILELWHIFNPREYRRPPSPHHEMQGPDIFEKSRKHSGFGETQPFSEENKKYPVLMIHGLLQSSGAYCSNDDDSLAFYLAKSGYDVWLGNNRSGFKPKHVMLDYTDPRMWAWNIRQMGVLDLPALISRVLAETGFPKLALIAHSQGTTETFLALAKEQRPDIGEKISAFCALAPAAYAGPLIGKMYFRVMRLVSPALFRIIFGIHAFIPLMMLSHKILPPRLYSWMGYHVFAHLFSWSDARWDRDLRNRMFQWAPVYVSSESMRWWLGRECFAKHKCILATREEGMLEDQEDEEDDEVVRRATMDREPHVNPRKKLQRNLTSFHSLNERHQDHSSRRGRFAWYNDQFPPLALWIAGADDLVDGRRLLRRFDRGREPHVRVVHSKIIDGYEHLDVIWAMDAIEKVGKEVREVIWRTADPESAAKCRTPVGCSRPLDQDPDIHDDVPMMHSGGRLRMASFSQTPTLSTISTDTPTSPTSQTRLDASVETEAEHDYLEEEDKVFNRRPSEPEFMDLQEKGNPLE
ncbi:hypothetical protein LTR37_013869 [Vermiconidia calcicola]|uniref:Uncharacterized protein n=1 Tax=Vermiconidia calcicola TaxID=1690605 RepID=A0ACC3MVA2_9PEZI|nr:hypothetical protein LTR37_013869 [Vermiconidia calcicola]